MAVLDGKQDERKWKHVELKGGEVVYRGRKLETRWVRFKTELEDAYHIYQKGQAVELQDKRKLMLYLEEGYVEPCEPQEVKATDYGKATAMYRFLTSMVTDHASYSEGRSYELPVGKAQKWVERGICERLKDMPEPETAMRPSGRR